MSAAQSQGHCFVSILIRLQGQAQTSVHGGSQNGCGPVRKMWLHLAVLTAFQNHCAGSGSLRRHYRQYSGTNDGGLLAGNLGDGLAQVFLVVQINRGDGDRFGSSHCRGVETTAQSGFQNSQIDAGTGEREQGNRRHLFKEGG